MAHNVFRQGGIPALASPSVDVASFSCLCSLVVKVDVACKRATIVLRFHLPLHGFDTDQLISLVYDAENLVPGATKLGQPNLCTSQSHQIVRNDGGNLRSLGVVLRQPCTVLCPLSSGSIAPKNGSDPHFQQLVNLAKATRLDIVFDYTWLNPIKSAQFLSLIDTPNLTGFCRKKKAALFREADWTVFTPGELAPSEVPPPYTDASLKRSRQSRTSSPQAPTAKRLLLDPATEIEPPSPTEEVTTTTATPSLQPFQSSPLGASSSVQDAVESAVAKLLPDALQAVLPDMLTRLLAVPTSSPSPRATPAPRNPMSPLHRLILTRLTTHADELAQQVTVDVRDTADELAQQVTGDFRDIANIELQEQLDDHRIDISLLKEDGLVEINRLCDTKLQELQEYTAELMESVEQDIVDAYTTAKEKLDEFVEEKWKTLVKELLMLEPERRLRRSFTGERLRRASSLPLEAGW